MLRPLANQLSSVRFVLASGSPRRQELIRNLGIEHVELITSTFEENLDPLNFASYGEFVEETALGKASEVFDRLQKDNACSKDLLVVGADTIVELNGKIYGKPKTNDIAFQMLSELINRQHVVHTGVVIRFRDQIVKFRESTKVTFGEATSEQIQAYVDTKEPLDKAGGYGIQGVGGCLIKQIEGDYFTVVGLPLYRLSVEICKLFSYEIK